jgi:hypothetical protein
MTDWDLVYTLAGISFVIFMVLVIIFTWALEGFDDLHQRWVKLGNGVELFLEWYDNNYDVVVLPFFTKDNNGQFYRQMTFKLHPKKPKQNQEIKT